jgi:hypothetical protein
MATATTPADKLVKVLETLPPETRQEIIVWLLGRQAGGLSSPWLPEVQRARLGSTLSTGEDSQLVTIRLPADRHAQLREWCADHAFTMAAVVRGLIERFLDEQSAKPGDTD